jgi:predicted negative regulator of RcsB-dependent stress response
MSEIIERESPSWHLPAMIVLGLIAIGGLWFGWNASSKLDTTQQTMSAQIKTSQQAVQQDVSSLKDRLAQDEKANADLQGDLTVVTKKLKITQGQLKNAREEAHRAGQLGSFGTRHQGHQRRR